MEIHSPLSGAIPLGIAPETINRAALSPRRFQPIQGKGCNLIVQVFYRVLLNELNVFFLKLRGFFCDCYFTSSNRA